MRVPTLLAAVAVGLLLSGASAAPAPFKPPKKKIGEAIKGKWQMTSRVDDGVVTPAEVVKRRTMTIEADKYSIYEGNNLWVRCAYKLDGSKKPPWFQATILQDQFVGETQLGIVKVDGDKMILCIARVGRPDAFTSTPGSGRILVTYTRAKK
jgi:uncharacterized protein (TIGR03067 family)